MNISENLAPLELEAAATNDIVVENLKLLDPTRLNTSNLHVKTRQYADTLVPSSAASTLIDKKLKSNDK